MNKLFALFGLFRKGSAVANPELWKNGGAALQAVLVPFLAALASVVCTIANAYCFTLSPEAAAAIAGGVVAVVGVVTTYITSDKVGIPAKPETPANSDPSGA